MPSKCQRCWDELNYLFSLADKKIEYDVYIKKDIFNDPNNKIIMEYYRA